MNCSTQICSEVLCGVVNKILQKNLKNNLVFFYFYLDNTKISGRVPRIKLFNSIK